MYEVDKIISCNKEIKEIERKEVKLRREKQSATRNTRPVIVDLRLRERLKKSKDTNQVYHSFTLVIASYLLLINFRVSTVRVEDKDWGGRVKRNSWHVGQTSMINEEGKTWGLLWSPVLVWIKSLFHFLSFVFQFHGSVINVQIHFYQEFLFLLLHRNPSQQEKERRRRGKTF